MNDKLTFIYALRDPRDNEIRYVGKSDNPHKRLIGHLSDTTVCYRTNWVAELRREKLIPEIMILDRVPKAEWTYWEKYYIERLSRVFNLTNSTGGGDGLENPSLETRRKMREAAIGRLLSNEAKRKVSEFNKGKVVSEETRRKMSIAQIGHIVGEDQKRKIGNAHRGKVLTPEQIEKVRLSSTGRVHTKETKRKISEANKGRRRSPEVRLAISERAKKRVGWHHSEETKRKMSESGRGKRHSEETKRKISETKRKTGSSI